MNATNQAYGAMNTRASALPGVPMVSGVPQQQQIPQQAPQQQIPQQIPQQVGTAPTQHPGMQTKAHLDERRFDVTLPWQCLSSSEVALKDSHVEQRFNGCQYSTTESTSYEALDNVTSVRPCLEVPCCPTHVRARSGGAFGGSGVVSLLLNLPLLVFVLISFLYCSHISGLSLHFSFTSSVGYLFVCGVILWASTTIRGGWSSATPTAQIADALYSELAHRVKHNSGAAVPPAPGQERMAQHAEQGRAEVPALRAQQQKKFQFGRGTAALLADGVETDTAAGWCCLGKAKNTTLYTALDGAQHSQLCCGLVNVVGLAKKRKGYFANQVHTTDAAQAARLYEDTVARLGGDATRRFAASENRTFQLVQRCGRSVALALKETAMEIKTVDFFFGTTTKTVNYDAIDTVGFHREPSCIVTREALFVRSKEAYYPLGFVETNSCLGGTANVMEVYQELVRRTHGGRHAGAVNGPSVGAPAAAMTQQQWAGQPQFATQQPLAGQAQVMMPPPQQATENTRLVQQQGAFQ